MGVGQKQRVRTRYKAVESAVFWNKNSANSNATGRFCEDKTVNTNFLQQFSPQTVMA